MKGLNFVCILLKWKVCNKKWLSQKLKIKLMAQPFAVRAAYSVVIILPLILHAVRRFNFFYKKQMTNRKMYDIIN